MGATLAPAAPGGNIDFSGQPGRDVSYVDKNTVDIPD